MNNDSDVEYVYDTSMPEEKKKKPRKPKDNNTSKENTKSQEKPKETENNIIHFSKNSFHYWLLNAILCLLEKKWMDGVYNLDICLSMNLEYEMQILILQLICNILRQLKNYRLLAEYQDTLLNIII